MEEQKKRRGYSTIKQQMDATKRYLENNPNAKLKKKRASYKSYTRTFLNEFATEEELLEFLNLIQNKLKNRE